MQVITSEIELQLFVVSSKIIVNPKVNFTYNKAGSTKHLRRENYPGSVDKKMTPTAWVTKTEFLLTVSIQRQADK